MKQNLSLRIETTEEIYEIFRNFRNVSELLGKNNRYLKTIDALLSLDGDELQFNFERRIGEISGVFNTAIRKWRTVRTALLDDDSYRTSSVVHSNFMHDTKDLQKRMQKGELREFTAEYIEGMKSDFNMHKQYSERKRKEKISRNLRPLAQLIESSCSGHD